MILTGILIKWRKNSDQRGSTHISTELINRLKEWQRRVSSDHTSIEGYIMLVVCVWGLWVSTLCSHEYTPYIHHCPYMDTSTANKWNVLVHFDDFNINSFMYNYCVYDVCVYIMINCCWSKKNLKSKLLLIGFQKLICMVNKWQFL